MRLYLMSDYSRCLVHDKYYRLDGVHTVALTEPKSRFATG